MSTFGLGTKRAGKPTQIPEQQDMGDLGASLGAMLDESAENLLGKREAFKTAPQVTPGDAEAYRQAIVSEAPATLPLENQANLGSSLTSIMGSILPDLRKSVGQSSNT